MLCGKIVHVMQPAEYGSRDDLDALAAPARLRAIPRADHWGLSGLAC